MKAFRRDSGVDWDTVYSNHQHWSEYSKRYLQHLGGSPEFGGSNSNNPFNNSTSSCPCEGARIGYVKRCDPYTHSSDPFNRLNAACFFAPSPASIGAESGLNWVRQPACINFDMSLEKEFSVKERVRF